MTSTRRYNMQYVSVLMLMYQYDLNLDWLWMKVREYRRSKQNGESRGTGIIDEEKQIIYRIWFDAVWIPVLRISEYFICNFRLLGGSNPFFRCTISQSRLWTFISVLSNILVHFPDLCLYHIWGERGFVCVFFFIFFFNLFIFINFYCMLNFRLVINYLWK